MQNVTEKIRKLFQSAFSYFKNIIKGSEVTSSISFENFFLCERWTRLLGFKFLENSENSLNKWLKLNGIISQIAMIAVGFLTFISTLISVQQRQVYMVLENILMTGVLIVALIKVYIVIFKNKKKIVEIIEKLSEHFPHSGVDQLEFGASKYWKVLNLMNTIYIISYCAITPCFCLIPIIFQLYASYKSVDLEWVHILALNLKFDQLQPVWHVIFTVLFLACSDLLYASLMQILVMEFDILGKVLSEISYNDREEETVKRLKNLIDIHQELIEISEKLEQIFSPILLINSFCAISALCATCFLSVVISVVSNFEVKIFLTNLFFLLDKNKWIFHC